MRVGEVLEILRHRGLTREESATLFAQIVDGALSSIEIAGLLGAFKARGETPDTIAGAAHALREAALAFPRPDYVFADTCGTGGDTIGTRNVSTAVAVVAACLGIPVAKHGNRAVSSRCGSADVLESLGVQLDASPDSARRCLDETGLCFLFAPQYHAGVRHAMPVRKTLGTRTLFNLLGPLVNPARPPIQIMGVYDQDLCRPLAVTLDMLGVETALVVHGSGLDEIALHGPTRAVLLKAHLVMELEITPEEAGLERVPLGALRGGDPSENARALRGVLAGQGPRAYRDVVSLNAGALTWVAGKATSLAEGVAMAGAMLDSGAAASRLDLWIEGSRRA